MTEAKIKLRVVELDCPSEIYGFRVDLVNPFRCWTSLTSGEENAMWDSVEWYSTKEEAEEDLKGLQKFLEAHKDHEDFEWIVRYLVSSHRTTRRPLTSLQLEQGAKASKAETLKKISEDFKCTFVEDENDCTLIKFGREPKLYPGDEKRMEEDEDFEPFEVMFFGAGEWGPYACEASAHDHLEDEVYESFITYEVK